jgi:hypothetical protein
MGKSLSIACRFRASAPRGRARAGPAGRVAKELCCLLDVPHEQLLVEFENECLGEPLALHPLRFIWQATTARTFTPPLCVKSKA